jgi:magnesium transporter
MYPSIACHSPDKGARMEFPNFLACVLEQRPASAVFWSVVTHGLPDVNSALRDVACPAPVHLREAETVFQALARLRSERDGHAPVYFYVTDSVERLVGVVPTRRLLLSEPATLVGELMMYPVISVGESATFGKALALLAEQRLLALPVVDELGRLTGTIDISGLTAKIFDLERRETADETFQMLAAGGQREQDCSLAQAVSRRLPWLLVCVTTGMTCAFLLSLFAAVLEKAVAVAFFIPVVILVAERIAFQTAGTSLRRLNVIRRRNQESSIDWRVGLVLASASSLCAGIWAAGWLHLLPFAAVLGCSVLAASAAGLAAGYTIPRLVRRWNWQLKVPSGPLVLAITDVAALSCYLALCGVFIR